MNFLFYLNAKAKRALAAAAGGSYRLDPLSFHLQFGFVDRRFALNASGLRTRLSLSLGRSGALHGGAATHTPVTQEKQRRSQKLRAPT